MDTHGARLVRVRTGRVAPFPGCWRVAEWKPEAFAWLFACDFESMGSVSRFSNMAGSSSLACVSVGALCCRNPKDVARMNVSSRRKNIPVPRCFPGGWVFGADFFAKKLEKSLDWDKKLAYLCTRFRAGNGPWARGEGRGGARFFDTDETRKDKQRRASGMFFLRDARKPWRGQ